jgi:hypothetical protein
MPLAILLAGGANHRGVHTLQHRPLPERVRDDLGAPTLLEEEPLEEIGGTDHFDATPEESRSRPGIRFIRLHAGVRVYNDDRGSSGSVAFSDRRRAVNGQQSLSKEH